MMGRTMITGNNMVGFLAEVKEEKDKRERQLYSYWEQKYMYYVDCFFENEKSGTREFDSFEIAAILAFTMSRGFETRKDFSNLELYIRNYLQYPFTCTVTKEPDSGDRSKFTWGYKKSLKPVNDLPGTVGRMCTETVDSMSKYVHFAAQYSNLKALAAEFRSGYEVYKNM